MTYTLVNVDEMDVTLCAEDRRWRMTLDLLVWAGWEPEGARGLWIVMPGEPRVECCETRDDMLMTYVGRRAQLVAEGDARAMAVAARNGLSMCDSDPGAAFVAIRTVLGGDKAATATPEAIRMALDEAKSMLGEILGFASGGPFLID